MIREEADAALVNRVANSAGVREGVCYHDRDMDWTPLVGRDDAVILSDGEDACAVFVRTNDRIWQAHTMFGGRCRGRRAIETGKAMLRAMRERADMVWGATPVGNCAARWFNRQLGAMPVCRDLYEAEGEVEVFVVDLRAW